MAECLECLGGNGYVEESGMPRLYRQAPLNSIWEGSGNVQCLDVLRTMATRPRRARGLLRRGRRGLGRFESRPLRLRASLRPGRDDRHRGAGARSRRAHGARPAGLAPAALRRSRPSPTHSARAVSAATGDAPSAPCRAAPTSTASSSVTAQRRSSPSPDNSQHSSCLRSIVSWGAKMVEESAGGPGLCGKLNTA